MFLNADFAKTWQLRKSTKKKKNMLHAEVNTSSMCTYTCACCTDARLFAYIYIYMCVDLRIVI